MYNRPAVLADSGGVTGGEMEKMLHLMSVKVTGTGSSFRHSICASSPLPGSSPVTSNLNM